MRDHGFIVALLVVLGLVLSGCGGSGPGTASSPETGPEGGQQEPATTTEEAPAGGSVLLTVTDSAGNPVAGAVVRLSGALAGEEATGADGVSLFVGLPAGSYTLQAWKDDMSHPNIDLEVTGAEPLERRATLRPVKEFSIFGAIRDVTDYRFDDSVPGPGMAVEEGDLVRIVFSVPENDIAHALTIDELGVSSPTVGAGESAIIEFVADKSGQFLYYCPLPSHRTLGMEGKFVVT